MVSEAVPPVVIAATDVARLRRLALRASEDADPTARFLLSELDRASVFEAVGMPDDVVRIDHWVTYRGDRDAAPVTRVLALPDDCANPDIHLSVMSPVGAALLGLRVGARMPYRDGGGTVRIATVENLTPPAGIAFFRRNTARPTQRQAGFEPPPDPDPGPSAA